MEQHYSVLIVGVGFMGTNHAIVLLDQQKLHDNVRLVGVADINAGNLAAFSQSYPHIPTFLLNENTTVADVIRQTGATAIADVTNTNAHPGVIKSALSVPDAIHTVFQEKPIAVTLNDADEMAKLITTQNITYSMDSIMMHSPIWKDFEEALDDQQTPLQMEFIRCTYGKDRTKDSRPAVGGYVYLEGVHAIDISSHGIERLDPDSLNIVGYHGFLAEKASEDGTCLYAVNAHMQAISSAGNTVIIEQEGSLTFDQNYRRVQYGYARPDGKKLVLQLEFDTKARGDVLQGWVVDPADGSNVQVCNSAFANHKIDTPNGPVKIDKLFGFYDSVLSGHMTNVCGIGKALHLQAALDQVAAGAKKNLLQMPAQDAPHKPQFKAGQDMTPQEWKEFTSHPSGKLVLQP